MLWWSCATNLSAGLGIGRKYLLVQSTNNPFLLGLSSHAPLLSVQSDPQEGDVHIPSVILDSLLLLWISLKINPATHHPTKHRKEHPVRSLHIVK